ncbi:MAG: tyrosine-type recombinase/integrase [Pseudomonadota bacterium]
MNKVVETSQTAADRGAAHSLSGLVQRKVGRHHIAFFRASLQGLDIGDMADKYLETGMDLRRAKTTLVWIRDTLRQAALRHGKHREAHLIRLRVAIHGPVEITAKIPSLDEFRDEFDPNGFYTEKELLQAYLEAHPQSVDTQARKRQRLISRQLEALKWIEPLIAADPVREDWVAAWFDETISKRLLLANMATLGDLMDRIAGSGYRWWVGVPRLGEKGAARIVAWLRGYEPSLGAIPEQSLVPLRSISTSALIQTRQMCTGIVPLESFASPADLDGRDGSNRYPGAPRIDATNDYQAIFAWLATKSGNPNTQRAYQKEAERMLLWAVLERGKALSSLSVDDCAAYRDWLSMLGRTEAAQWPFRVGQDAWIGEKGTARHKQGWKPFDGALSAKSVKYAITIVSGLFDWLVQVQYCSFNPWVGVSKTLLANLDTPAPDVEFMRAFTVGQWDYLMSHLAGMPGTRQTARLKFVLPFAYSTGMRIAELVDATIGRIYTMPLTDNVGVRWMLKVLGKGGKWRAVPIPSDTIEALKAYLAHRGLNHDILSNPPETPLIASLTSNEPVTTSGLSKALGGFFDEVANTIKADGKRDEAKAFERATVHWLRHTCGSHLALSGEVPLNVIQRLLGHSSLQTTSIYTDASDENLWRAVERAGQGRTAKGLA